MKIAILLILAVSLNAVSTDLNRQAQKHVDALMKTNWGQTILQLAELHAHTGGVLQDLVGAIEEMIQQMQDELDEVEYNYGVRTNEHNSLSLQYTQEVQDADIDIQRSADTLENLLYPRREQLKGKIQQLMDYQEFNRKTVDEETLIREQEHEAFEAQVAELNDAVGATDDALNLLSTLTNPSLVQIQKFQSNLRKIEARIQPHSQHQTLIKALITLASEQNFSDQGIIKQIVDKLNEFRNAVVDAINAATAQEAQDVQDYEDRIEQLDAEYAEFQRQITKVTIDLNATQEKIEQFLSFQAQRQSDRNTAQALLDLENEQFADDTQIYTDLKNKLIRDIQVTEEAFSLVKSVDFSRIKV
ncbi:unnamed protein product [Paramecium sonneborni]|uniref:Uncharacterized protein n=1 Tax=Paramecium sonneborni TaxID=65129 RepID=A0A8S1NZV8_9CILI|nr:unnamed protein product [Paramecium sonneborni]